MTREELSNNGFELNKITKVYYKKYNKLRISVNLLQDEYMCTPDELEYEVHIDNDRYECIGSLIVKSYKELDAFIKFVDNLFYYD
jgi:hypothetical protein